MRVAITGATGFVGNHLARALSAEGHEIVLIARGVDRRDPDVHNLAGARFIAADVADEDEMTPTFEGCEAVAHCAGINREKGRQAYERVHVLGTRSVVNAARRQGVKRVLLVSFLRARPSCGSPYHESKWAAEEIVRSSGLEYLVVKAAMMYGRGDHMLQHLGLIADRLHVLPLVGLRQRPIRPVSIDDAVRILRAFLIEGRLSGRTVAILGPEEMFLANAARRVAQARGRFILTLRIPVLLHYVGAWVLERFMRIPLASRAQVRMLSEGIAEALPGCDALPPDLRPRQTLDSEKIRAGLNGAMEAEQ
jgi:NADH dehydrogenase